MRSEAQVELVLGLLRGGVSVSAAARETGVPRSTVRDWAAGRLPHGYSPDGTRCPKCGGEHDLVNPPSSYVYLLGMYLGDGSISEHARGVARMRVHLDLKYPAIIDEVERAISDLVPQNRVHRQLRRSKLTDRDELSYVIVSAYSKTWPCWFPQHGPGKKHERTIELAQWQRLLVDRRPWPFLRGLIHSDGCRFINTGTNWSNPRYSFSNQSADIRNLFADACSLVGLHTTRAPHTVYVSKKADVAEMDLHIGPKR